MFDRHKRLESRVAIELLQSDYELGMEISHSVGLRKAEKSFEL